ncbi:MAG: DNA replication and repair protein RecF [Bdellovibrionales bacterium]|nr:DNA replication and repair protein RecF [Bdellovibrionales bacterium]
MKIKSLKARNFRNLDDISIPFPTPVTAFLGQNGQGKTNLIESIFIGLTGDSFRPGRSSIFRKKDSENPAWVQMVVDKDGVDHEITYKIDKLKSISLNGKRATAVQLLQKFPVVLFSPESLTAVKGGPDIRRQLIDQLLLSVEPSAARDLAEFGKALKSRNRVLKQHLEGQISRRTAEDILDSLTPGFIELAVRISMLRIDALREIKQLFSENFQSISGTPNVETSVDYVISDEVVSEISQPKLRNAMNNRLKELRNAEMDSGNTLVGPHKHDIAFKIDGNEARYYGSQGQQRALILAFKMAQIVYHYRLHQCRPILFLDDVFSELDESKRTRLVEFLKSIETQTFFSTTEWDIGEDNDYHFSREMVSKFQVSGGRVTKEG